MQKKSYTLKGGRIVQDPEYQADYTYNKKGQILNVSDGKTVYEKDFKYDKKGYLVSYTVDDDHKTSIYKYKITYKKKLPSVVKELKDRKTINKFHLYFTKKKVSNIKATKEQQYCLTHIENPKASAIYRFDWYAM